MDTQTKQVVGRGCKRKEDGRQTINGPGKRLKYTDDATIYEGVFSFKRSKGNKRKVCGISSLDYWSEVEDEDIKEVNYKNYVKCWQMVTNILNDLQSSIHAKVFEDLVKFVRNSGEESCTINASTTGGKSVEGQRDIPTACLVTGVNMPDHDAVFSSLVGLLVEGVTPHIAQLRSRECTTLRGAIHKMITQLMGQNDLVDLDFEDEMMKVPSIKRTQVNMAVLTSWYQELTSTALQDDLPSKLRGSPQKVAGYTCKDVTSCKAMASPRKSMASPRKTMASPRKTIASPRKIMVSPNKTIASPRKTVAVPCKIMESTCRTMESPSKPKKSPAKKMKLSNEPSPPKRGLCPPLVVILEDVESFPANILHDLILICSGHRCSLPIVFVFGVSTTPAAVHRSLSQDASACVAMETFQAQPSTHYLNYVIEKVLMSEKVPFHVGGRPFKLLLDIFLYNDLSVKNFIKGLKLCMIQHFLGNSSAFLCCPASERASRIKAMPPAQLDVIHKLPSFRSYVESRPPKEQTALLLDEKTSKAAVRTLMNELDSWYGRFCCLVKVVHALTSSLPSTPLGRQVREVLTTCLSQNLVETEEFKEADKMLRLMAHEELLPILTNILDILREWLHKDEELSVLYDELAVILGRLNSLDQLDQVIDNSPSEELPLNIQSSDRFQLKEKLLEIAKKKNKRPNAYELLRSEVLQLLSNVFELHLQPVNKQPLHEILFFESSSSVKQHLVGMPRAPLTTALSNPHHYLQCDCCQLEDPSSVVTTLPDVSVVYKLHLECGRLINLYDWLQAYISVADPEEDTSSKNAIDQRLQARFVQAVSEMQFLGFVKATSRKTDHVARLTWGGC